MTIRVNRSTDNDYNQGSGPRGDAREPHEMTDRDWEARRARDYDSASKPPAQVTQSTATEAWPNDTSLATEVEAEEEEFDGYDGPCDYEYEEYNERD